MHDTVDKTFRDRIFSFDVTVTLAQNETFVIVPEEIDGQARKYLPFTVVNVFNNSDETIKAEVNEGAQSIIRVAPKTSKTITGVKARTIKITNLSSSSTSLDEITVEFQSEDITSDEFFRVVSRAPLINRLFRLRGSG